MMNTTTHSLINATSQPVHGQLPIRRLQLIMETDVKVLHSNSDGMLWSSSESITCV